MHFERLHRLAAIDVEDQIVEEMLYDKKFQPAIKHISCLKQKYELKMEIDFAMSLINSQNPGVQNHRLIILRSFWPKIPEAMIHSWGNEFREKRICKKREKIDQFFL